MSKLHDGTPWYLSACNARYDHIRFAAEALKLRDKVRVVRVPDILGEPQDQWIWWMQIWKKVELVTFHAGGYPNTGLMSDSCSFPPRILRLFFWIHGYGLSTQRLSWWMLVLYVEWPPLAPSHCTSIGRRGRVKFVMHILLWYCTWRRSLLYNPPSQKVMMLVFSQLIKPDANYSTFWTGDRPWSARFSYQRRPEEGFNDVTNVFSLTTIWTAKRKKRSGCHEDSPVFWRVPKKSGFQMIFSASINFKILRCYPFFWILTCPKNNKMIFCMKTWPQRLDTSKVQDISTSLQWSSSSDVHQPFYSSGGMWG